MNKSALNVRVAGTGLLIVLLVLAGFFTGGCSGSPASMVDETIFIQLEGDGIARETRLTLKDLKAMEEGLVEDEYFSINTYGTREQTAFKGVWVWYVLQNSVELSEEASTVRFIAEDGYKVEYTLEEVARSDYLDEQDPEKKLKLILAWEQDGKAFDPQAGNPLQLVVGQREPGDVNKPFWVRNVETIVID